MPLRPSSTTDRLWLVPSVIYLFFALFVARSQPTLAEKLDPMVGGVSLNPAQPQAGQIFVLELRLPDVPAADIRLDIPETGAALVYLGSELLPEALAGGASLIRHRFSTRADTLAALPPGPDRNLALTLRLSVHIREKAYKLGSLVIPLSAPAAQAKPTRVEAQWQAPARVYRYQAFGGVITDSSGYSLELPPTVSVPGALFEQLPGGGSFLVSGQDTFDLPELNYTLDRQSIRVPARTVVCIDPPPGCGALGSYQLRPVLTPGPYHPGQRVQLQLLIDGYGAPVLLKLPAVGLVRPGMAGAAENAGRVQPLEPENRMYQHFEPASNGWKASCILYYEFSLEAPGSWSLRFEPWQMLDPAQGGKLWSIKLPNLDFEVSWPEEKPGRLEAAFRSELLALLSALAGERPAIAAWHTAVAEFDPSADSLFPVLPADLSDALYRSRVAPPEFWTPAPDRLELLALATSFLLLDQKQAALSLLYELRRHAWSPTLDRFIRTATVSLGYPEAPLYRWPAPGSMLLLLAGTALAAILWLGILLLLRRSRYGTMAIPVAAMLMALLIVVLSLAERRNPLLACGPVPVRTVPSQAASIQFTPQPGLPGRIVSRNKQWLFVEFMDGRSGWISLPDGLSEGL